MSQEEIFKKICNLLARSPGLHVSKIAELLNMRIAELESYLQILVKQDTLFVTTDEGLQRYFLKEHRANVRDARSEEIKREIYTLVAQNPGLHLSKIADFLHISIPLADYHLLQLEKTREISSVKDPQGYYKRYYVAEEQVESNEKRILEELKKKIPLQIVLYLLKTPVLQHKDLLKQLNISSSTLSYHLTKLVQSGLLEVQPHGAEKGYALKNREEIKRILKKYEFHIEVNVAVENFKNMWGDWDYHEALR
jgi:predicted transcriptional regulator